MKIDFYTVNIFKNIRPKSIVTCHALRTGQYQLFSEQSTVKLANNLNA